MNRPNRLLAALTLLSIVAIARADDVQVEDLAPAAVLPAATDTAAAPQTPPATAATPASSDHEEITWQKLQSLQEQLRLLRGQLEDQQHLIDELRQQVKTQYMNTDQRLSAMDGRIGQLLPANGAAANTPAATPTNNPAAPAVTATPTSSVDAEKNAYLAAWELSRQKGPDQAIPRMLAFIQQYPQSAFMPHAQYWLGVFYMKATQPDLDKARQYFQNVLKQYPQHSKASAALYQLAVLHDQKGEEGAARIDMRRLLKDYPQSPEVQLATSWLKKHPPGKKKKHTQASLSPDTQATLHPIAQALDHIGEYAP